jgi:hypothetical protein
MLVIYRVVRRGMTGLPIQYDISKPKLQVSTAIPFTGMGYELSGSPTISSGGCDSPYKPLPPPYGKDPLETFPQTPTAKPAHMSPVQKLGMKQEIWV